MSFKEYVTTEVLLLLFVVLTLPLWLPVAVVILLKDWYEDCRYGWECMERNRIHDEAHAATAKAGVSVDRHQPFPPSDADGKTQEAPLQAKGKP